MQPVWEQGGLPGRACEKDMPELRRGGRAGYALLGIVRDAAHRKEDAGAARTAAGTDTAACSGSTAGSGAGSRAAAGPGSQGPVPDGAEPDVLL